MERKWHCEISVRVLIVAKCNVNVFAPESKADYMFVLIVAKCNVNIFPVLLSMLLYQY